MKSWSFALGVGLLVLWIVGLGSPDSAAWVTWLDFFGALAGFAVAGFTPDYIGDRSYAAGPGAIALGLWAVWIIGMATNGAPWQNGWNFVFGAAYALVAFYTYNQSGGRRISGGPSEQIEKRDYRKSA